MILGILIFLSSITMFEDINMKDYNLDFELQRSYFLRDCLNEVISFTLENRSYSGPDYISFPTEQVIIYKKSDNGIIEEISMDELIFYIQTEVLELMRKFNWYLFEAFSTHFNSIDNIKKSVNNMKIILKYDNDVLLTDYWRRNIKKLNLKNNPNQSPKI